MINKQLYGFKKCRYYKGWKEIKDHDASDNQYILAKLKNMLELLTIDGRLKCKKGICFTWNKRSK